MTATLVAATYVVACDYHVSDLMTEDAAARHLASIERLGACSQRHEVILATELLRREVMYRTGCDPDVEPEFEGVSMDRCQQCSKVTAVTTLYTDDLDHGSRFKRICLACMVAE